jgi:hypothetical protein
MVEYCNTYCYVGPVARAMFTVAQIGLVWWTVWLIEWVDLCVYVMSSIYIYILEIGFVKIL